MSAEFVDTNILIDAHGVISGPKKNRSADLLDNVWENQNGAIGTQVLSEFHSSLTRKLGLPSEEAEEIIRELKTWTIHRPEHADILGVIHLQRTHQLSWWDAMIVNSAIKMNCRILWTENLIHGRRFGDLMVQNPFL